MSVVNRFVRKIPAMELVADRNRFLGERVRDRVTLHLGCVDEGDTERAIAQGYFLHAHLARSARKLYGVDIDTIGLQQLRESGFQDLTELNVFEIHQRDWPGLEVVIAGEILEHLSSFERFFNAFSGVLSRYQATGILTVPNAFSFRNLISIAWGNRELVNSDHNCYFSPATLERVVARHGLMVTRLLSYSDIARVSGAKRWIKKALNASLFRIRPAFAEGLIVEVTPAVS